MLTFAFSSKHNLTELLAWQDLQNDELTLSNLNTVFFFFKYLTLEFFICLSICGPFLKTTNEKQVLEIAQLEFTDWKFQRGEFKPFLQRREAKIQKKQTNPALVLCLAATSRSC